MSTNAPQNTAEWFPCIRLPFDVYETAQSLFRNYLFIHLYFEYDLPTCPPKYRSPACRCRTSCLKTRLRQIQNLLFAGGRGRGEDPCKCRAQVLCSITELDRPRTNHFARPTMLSWNLELCISSKMNRIFACHAELFISRASHTVSARHFFERVG